MPLDKRLNLNPWHLKGAVYPQEFPQWNNKVPIIIIIIIIIKEIDSKELTRGKVKKEINKI